MYTINETNYHAIKNLLAKIDEEEAKEDYEDIDTDAVLEYTSDILHIIRSIVND